MALTFEFPVPVLSVAAEAVRELEGGEALSGLWTLFTKCKASLQDGHRLENISWRLWYREMAAERPRCASVKDSWNDTRLVDEKASKKFPSQGGEKAYLTTQEILPSRTGNSPSSASPRISVSSPHPHPKSQLNVSTPLLISRPTLVRRNSYVGRIIVDMLPNALPPTQYPNARTTRPFADPNFITSYFSPAIRTSLGVSQPPDPTIPAADTHSLPIRCHLLTPAASEEHSLPPSSPPSSTLGATASPPALPIVQVEVSAPSTPPQPPSLPRLVVEKPTPGPTPHPTPPATPVLGGVPLKHDPQRSLGVPSGTLLPMPKQPCQPAKFTLADGSTTSSSSSDSSGSGRTVASSPSTTVSAAGNSSHKLETLNPIASTVAAVPATAAANTKSGSPTVPPLAPPPPSSSQGHLLPEAAGAAPHAGPSRTRSRAQGHIRQASSTSSAAGGRGTGRPVEGRNKTKSTSRSRSRGVDVGLTGLTMTVGGAGVVGTKKGVVAGKGRALGALRRSASGRAGVLGRAGREKRPTFNIGSHSDEGSALGSKSAGSGSSVSGPKNEVEGKNNVVKAAVGAQPAALPQRTQSSTRLPPPPSAQRLPDLAKVIPPQQQQRRTIVLATSDSDDYETETDSESGSENGRVQDVEADRDAGEWSSEELSGDDVEVVVRRGGQQQAQPSAQTQPSNHTSRRNNSHSQQTNHARPPPTQNAQQTQHQPHPQPQPPQPQHQHQHQHLSRVQQSRRNHAAHAHYVVEQAALEAQRIREMFAKKPVPSSEQLAWKRTRSVGLLTQLMNPDPQIFPPSHPYRRGHSSGEIKGVAAGGLTMTAPGKAGERRGSEHGQGQRQIHGQGHGQEQGLAGQRRASAGMAPGLKLSKSSAALPIASQVQVGSVARETSLGAAAVNGGSGASGGYRPKGRPADQEMEEDSDSDAEENGRDAVLGSKSMVQEKLEAFARRRGIVPNDKKDAAPEEAEPVPDRSKETESRGNGRRATHPPPNGASSSRHQQPRRQEHAAPAPIPAPIPLGHPYNLPPPAPPSTPRTTRRLMLQTEMSESLRRNLLWERQVSKVNLAGIRRTASGGGGGTGSRGGTILGGGLRPLTALPSMVQLTARQQGAVGNVNGSGRPEDRERERRGSGGAVLTEAEQEREAKKKRALARNKSWANDYHYSGW